MSEYDTIDLNRLYKRKLVWDILPCPDQADSLPDFDLLPGSPGGNEREHAMSHHRLNVLAGIADSVQLLGRMAGEIAGHAILESQGIDVDDALGRHNLEMFSKVGAASALAVIANLAEQRMISIEGGELG